MRTVVIIQRVLPHYRVAFFDRLRDVLLSRDIQLIVVYGQERPGSVPRTVDFSRTWAHRILNRYMFNSRFELVWQPALEHLKEVDFVIVEPAVRLLFTHVLFAIRARSGIKIGFWGHGPKVSASTPSSAVSMLKGVFEKTADHWFAYTDSGRIALEAIGFDASRISVINNSVDTDVLQKAKATIPNDECERLKRQLGIVGDNVAIYCGGLYRDKRIDWLLDGCESVHKRLPDFHLIVIGDGPLRATVERAARNHKWIHYVGELTGVARVPYFLASKTLLMPGVVGLVVLDSFALAVPMITTNVVGHGPEISYLEHEVNGLVSEPTCRSFANAVHRVLVDHNLRARLAEGCVRSVGRFSIDSMVLRYAEGIEAALAAESGTMS